jgi:hypothetical protein
MSRWSRLIPVFAVTLLLAACGDGADTPLAAPGAGVYDEGGLLVGGNNTSDPGTGSGSGTTTGTSTGGGTVQSDTTSRGGGLLVGGN